MTHRLATLATAALLTVGVASFGNVASASPVGDALAIKKAAPSGVQAVRWGGGGRGFVGGGWRGRGWGARGWGIGAGILGGAIIAGALAAPYYYGCDPYAYGYGYGYPYNCYGPGYYPGW